MSAPFPWWTLAIPYRRFTISSPLDPAMARQRLANALGPHYGSRFEGELVGNEFKFRRIINYHNSFLPEVSGELMPSGAGTVISGRMVLHTSILVFLTAWLSVFGSVFVVLLASGNLHRWWTGPGAVAFLWLMVAGSFAFEASRTAQVLTDVLKGTLAWG